MFLQVFGLTAVLYANTKHVLQPSACVHIETDSTILGESIDKMIRRKQWTKPFHWQETELEAMSNTHGKVLEI